MIRVSTGAADAGDPAGRIMVGAPNPLARPVGALSLAAPAPRVPVVWVPAAGAGGGGAPAPCLVVRRKVSSSGIASAATRCGLPSGASAADLVGTGVPDPPAVAEAEVFGTAAAAETVEAVEAVETVETAGRPVTRGESGARRTSAEGRTT